MKFTLRTAFLVAFAVLVALVLGASRVAHIFAWRTLLEEELVLCREDLTAISNPPYTFYTMQVLHRLGFSWDRTSREYVDMIFDMLRSLGYLKV